MINEIEVVERIISLDILRGIAIFCMVFGHTLSSTFDTHNLSGIVDSTSPVYQLFFIGFLYVLSLMFSLFLLISATVHTYLTFTKIKKGASIELLTVKSVIMGFMIYCLGLIRAMFLDPEGILENYWLTGKWDESLFKWLYLIETLQIIGLGLITIAITIFILEKIRQFLKLKANVSLILNLIIFFSLSILFILFSTRLHYQILHAQNLDFFSDFRNLNGDTHARLERFVWVALIGEYASIFPYMGTAFIGCILGTFLALENVPKRLPQYILSSGLLLVLVGYFYGNNAGLINADIVYDIIRPWLYSIITGFELIFIGILLMIFEFNSRINSQKALRYTVFIRRWGYLSLTLYMSEILDMLPRGVATNVFHQDFRNKFQVDLFWGVVITIIVLVFWDIVLRLWEKLHFYGSWEWVLWSIRSGFRLRKSNSTFKRNIHQTLYDFEVKKYTKSKSEALMPLET